MTPMVKSKMTKMKEFVQNLAKSLCKKQLGELKKRIQQISSRPHSLKDFAAYVDTATQLRAKEKGLNKAISTVEQMYSLLKQHQVTVPPEDEVQLDDLHHVHEEYNAEMEHAINFKEERLPEMKTNLDMHISKVNENLVKMQQQLKEGVFIDALHFDEPSAVIEKLEQAKIKLEQEEEKSKTYTHYQELFNIPPYDYKNMKKTQEVFDQMNTLWTTVDKWNQQSAGWMGGEFVELDVEEINKDVQVYFKDSMLAHRKLNNDVTEKLKNKVRPRERSEREREVVVQPAPKADASASKRRERR
jgi:hypothetical protein